MLCYHQWVCLIWHRYSHHTAIHANPGGINTLFFYQKFCCIHFVIHVFAAHIAVDSLAPVTAIQDTNGNGPAVFHLSHQAGAILYFG